MKTSLKIIILSITLLNSGNILAEDSFWLAHKMVKKGADIPELFKGIPQGAIVTVLPKWIPKVCDFKFQITQFESSVYTVASCVYIGRIRNKS
jgi:hypothetical protein